MRANDLLLFDSPRGALTTCLEVQIMGETEDTRKSEVEEEKRKEQKATMNRLALGS